MGKRKKENETEKFVNDYIEFNQPVYPVTPESNNLSDKSINESERPPLNGWLLFTLLLAIIFLVFYGLSFNELQKEVRFYEAELNTFCSFYGYERMYKDDVAVYCVSDNKAISLLKVQARYLDYYLGGKKYDIRNYKVSYKDCPEDANLKYYSSKNIMQVVC